MSAPAAAPAAAPSVDDPDDVALYLFPPSHPARRMAKATIEFQFSIDDHEDSDVVGIHWRRLGREPPPGAAPSARLQTSVCTFFTCTK